jgi:hypothetical protein
MGIVNLDQTTRYILLFLQSEAVKTRSREIELGRSMHVWLGTMGLSIGGTTYKMVSGQARRISVCRLTFFSTCGQKELLRNGAFVEGAITLTEIGDQTALWQDRVRLDEGFYRALLDHPVPVSESALRAIGPRSMVIDTYILVGVPPSRPEEGCRGRLAGASRAVRLRLRPAPGFPGAVHRVTRAGLGCLPRCPR